MAVYPTKPKKLNGELSEPAIIKLTAAISRINPRDRKIKTHGVINLKRISEMLPMPYDNSAKVIIQAPIIDKTLILINSIP